MSISKRAFRIHCRDRTFKTNYIIAALLKWFIDIRMLLCGIATTFYSVINGTPSDTSLCQQSESMCIKVKKCDLVFKKPLSTNREHLALSYFSCHLGLSWQMRWGQLFSQKPRAQLNQSKCQPYMQMCEGLKGQLTQWHSELLYFSDERLTQEWS